MKRLLVLAGLAAALSVPTAAQAATTVQRVPFATDVFLCTSGDDVAVSGTLLMISSVAITPSGGFVAAFHVQPQGISAVDTATGTLYRATWLTRDIFVSSPAGGLTETFVNRVHLQATTGSESYFVKEIFHYTIGADGSVRIAFDKGSSPC